MKKELPAATAAKFPRNPKAVTIKLGNSFGGEFGNI